MQSREDLLAETKDALARCRRGEYQYVYVIMASVISEIAEAELGTTQEEIEGFLQRASFMCQACGGGQLVEVRKEVNGQIVVNCKECNKCEMLVCIICKCPRRIWADDGTICMLCHQDYLAGKIKLTSEQLADIMKWAVVLPEKK